MEYDYTKYLAPWEDSPGKGSRDSYMQNANAWGEENLGTYIQQNWGDPYGIFDKTSVDDYWNKFQQVEGGSGEPMPKFTNFTLPQLQSYLDRNKSGFDNRNNDAMWLPSFLEHGGSPYVSWGQVNAGKGGFFDRIDKYMPAVVGAALGGFASLAGAAGGAASGVGEGVLGGLLSPEGIAFTQGLPDAFNLGAFSGIPEAAAIGAGVGNSLMPAAVPELSMPNAVSGGVTATSGLDNAVTAGLAGTSGFGGPSLNFGAPTGAELGINPNVVDTTGFSQPFNLENIFDFQPTVGGYGNLSGYYPGDFTSSMLPGGSMSPFGSAGGGMVDLSGGGMGSVVGTGNQTSFLQDLMSRFGNMKDPLKLGASIAQQVVNKKNNKKMQDAINQSRSAGFPFQNYQHLAQMWSDPAQRYQMLQSNPAYKAAEDYVRQATARRNARTGDINSEFGAATMADALGRNASAWDKQMFDQIAQITGMGFNNNQVTSQLAAALYPQMSKNNNYSLASIGNAIAANQGFLPDMLKTFFS